MVVPRVFAVALDRGTLLGLDHSRDRPLNTAPADHVVPVDHFGYLLFAGLAVLIISSLPTIIVDSILNFLLGLNI